MLKVDKGTTFSDDVIDLKVAFLYEGKGNMGKLPMYGCFLFLSGTDTRIGEISLRIGSDNEKEIYYNSNIGYGINKEYRGNGFAGRACNLVKKIAQIEDMDELTISCNVENKSSIRVLEKIGAEEIEIVEVPSDFLDEHDEIPKRIRYKLKV